MDYPFVYGDEAGNTGPALLDLAQPVFVYAMTDLTPEEAKGALDVLGVKSQEAHSTNLFRRAGGVERIVKFFEYPAIRPHRVTTFVIHKKFMVITKMVDLLVENVAHEMGYDLYEGGQNIALANYANLVIDSILSLEQQERLLGTFVQMIKHRSDEVIEQFYTTLDKILGELSTRGGIFWIL